MSDTIKRLSKREREVVRAVARGCTNKQIAELLGISAFTVRNHLTGAMRKTGARNRAQLAAFETVGGAP
jgi:DNA-binding CsgD family transcriptional regulator